jgi:hypothetical protein
MDDKNGPLEGCDDPLNGEHAMIPQNSNEGRSVERTTACLCVSIIYRLMSYFLNHCFRDI